MKTIQRVQRPWRRVRMPKLVGVIELSEFVHGGRYSTPTWILIRSDGHR